MMPGVRWALVVLVLAGACNVWADEPATAQSTVEAWLSLLDERRFEASYAGTAPLFKAQIDAASWSSTVGEVRRSLGAFQSRELIGASYHSELPGAPAGDYVVFQYRSTFDDRDDAIETVTPMLVEGAWRISGYYVR